MIFSLGGEWKAASVSPPGESVPVEEQLSSRNKKNSSSETAAVSDGLAPPPTPLSDEEKTQYETLITSLYQQLDDKASPAWTSFLLPQAVDPHRSADLCFRTTRSTSRVRRPRS